MINFKELYKIEKISDQVVLAVCTTYINPISYLPIIEEDLSRINFTGKIIFDLLLSNGYNTNRFVEADVNEAKVDRKSMKVIDISSLDKTLIDRTYKFYKTHSDLVNNSNILLDEEKYYLLHDPQQHLDLVE